MTSNYSNFQKIENESDFFDGKISHVVAFDHLKFDFSEENKESLKNAIIKNGSISSVELIDLNLNIYSADFVEHYPDILKVILEIDIVNYINSIWKENLEEIELIKATLKDFREQSLSRKVNIQFCFDQIGVSSARFDFEIIADSIKTSKLINLTNDTGDLIDIIIFKKLKKDLFKHISYIKDSNTIYAVHDTYPIIVSTKFNINLKTNKMEIAGISSVNERFLFFSEDIITEKIKNGLSYYKDTLILVGHSATIMLLKRPKRLAKNPEKYIEERINAIEMYYRQKFLLKKVDFSLDRLIEDLGTNNNQNHDIKTLKIKIAKIKNTQIEIESKLDIYRNTRTSVSASFIIFFEILNEIFRLDNHYKFVREKLNACDKMYLGLYNQIRNELMENIQFIVVTIGSLSLILAFIDMVTGENATLKLILILSFILIILILRTTIKDIYNMLLRGRINAFE